LLCTAAGRRHPADPVAFTLIEVIAVLAIIAIVAAAALPVAIRQIDYANQATEGTNLVALAAGLTQGASAQRSIPSQANWATFIATNIGWQTTAVASNVNNPQNPRVFLINPALQIGTNTAANLPYLQTTNGATSIPVSPQFILISSLSSPLPANVTNNLSSSDFQALWNTPVGTIPTNTSFSWNNWQGQGADITIQDINLASSFVRLGLSVADPTNAYYQIDLFPLNLLTNGTAVNAWFLRGTVLNLYYPTTNSATNLLASQVLLQDSTWVFSGGLWRNAAVAASGNGGGGGGPYGGLQAIVQQFVANPSHNGMYPSNLFNDMMTYMSNYALFFTNSTSSSLSTKLNNNANAIYNDAVTLVPGE